MTVLVTCRVTGRKFPIENAPRRAGDPPEFWACADRIHQRLGWSPNFTQLDDIIATAWNWFQKQSARIPHSMPQGVVI